MQNVFLKSYETSRPEKNNRQILESFCLAERCREVCSDAQRGVATSVCIKHSSHRVLDLH